jgi:hypothetical protein
MRLSDAELVTESLLARMAPLGSLPPDSRTTVAGAETAFVYSPPVILSPSAVLSMWAAGVAAGVAVVVWWRIVGSGFVWLACGVILLLGVPAALAGDSVLAWIGCAFVVVMIGRARRSSATAIAAIVAAAFFGIAAASETDVIAVASGTVLLGTVTTEMMLGHWYLVDPRLPRWALRRLAFAAGFGALFDFGVLAILGAFPWSAGDTAVGMGFVLLAITTVVLMAAVVGALREEGYAGVMSATGLSYLALLTTIGAVVVGRLLVDGPVLS